jgi:hypothetical protein
MSMDVMVMWDIAVLGDRWTHSWKQRRLDTTNPVLYWNSEQSGQSLDLVIN